MALNEARQALRTPQVQSLNPPQFQESVTAKAIEAFGGFVGQARKGALESRQEEQINELTNELAVLHDPAVFTQEDGTLNLDFAPGASEIDETSGRFKRLAAAKAQGRLSESAIQIEAESILKQSINRAPGFADDFRQAAADILGFDPSGQLVKNMIDLYTQTPDDEESWLQQQSKKAAEIAAVLGLDESRVLKNMVESEYRDVQDNILDSMIKDGRANVTSIIEETGFSVAKKINPIFSQILTEVDQHGGIQDINFYNNQLDQLRMETVSRINSNMNEDPNRRYSSEARQEIVDSVDERINLIKQTIKNNDFVEVLDRNRKGVQAAMDVHGMQALPMVTMLNRTGGQAYVDWWLTMQRSLADGRDISKYENIPTVQNIRALENKWPEIRESLEFMSGDITDPDQIDKEVFDNVSGAGLSQDAPGSVFWNSVDSRLGIGHKPVETMSTIAQRRNSWSQATPEQRESVVLEAQAYAEGAEQRLVDTLTEDEQTLIEFVDGKFVAIDRQENIIDRTFQRNSAPSPLGVRGRVPAGRRDIDKLNGSVMALIKSDPRWASAIDSQGRTNPQEIGQQYALNINRQILENTLGREITPEERGMLESAETMTDLFRVAENIASVPAGQAGVVERDGVIDLNEVQF